MSILDILSLVSRLRLTIRSGLFFCLSIVFACVLKASSLLSVLAIFVGGRVFAVGSRFVVGAAALSRLAYAFFQFGCDDIFTICSSVSFGRPHREGTYEFCFMEWRKCWSDLLIYLSNSL